MKWTNKGHEFDYIGKNFKRNTKVYIYGAGENGIDLFKRMHYINCIEGFIDNDTQKVGKYIEGKKINSLQDFLLLDKPDHIVVVAQSLENTPRSLQQLLVWGYIEGRNLFDFHTFLDFYLPIFAYYAYDIVYVPVVSFLMTTLCNLDCKGCLNFNHFNANRKHYPIERLKKDVDIFFEHVDTIGLFHLCGGEPFLYPQFAELINYILSKYSERIFCLGTTTNGTVIPSDELCKALCNTKVKVWLDDYRENVALSREKMQDVECKLQANGINYEVNAVDSWLNIMKESTDDDIKHTLVKASSCNVPFLSLKDGKIYGCNYCDYAHEANVCDISPSDYFDLRQENDSSYLMEYVMGYSENGYYSLCKTCKGFSTINKDKLLVAEQYSKA